MALTLIQRHLLHFKRTLHLETTAIARALLRCSCIHGAEKSRGVDGTAWNTMDMLGKLRRAPTRCQALSMQAEGSPSSSPHKELHVG